MNRLILPALLAGTLGLWGCGTEATTDKADSNQEAAPTKGASYKIDGMT